MFKPLSANIFFPCALVSFQAHHQRHMEADFLEGGDDGEPAMMSHFMMPPKMFTNTALTRESARRMRNASVTCFSLAPPPTSRKLAGEPP